MRVLTQLGDADLLQILPGEVFDDADGVVAIFREFFVVLWEANGAEPLAQIRLRKNRSLRSGGIPVFGSQFHQ